MEKRVHRLFCYGTLKKNFYFHDRYLGNNKSDFLGIGLASTDYSLYVGAQPHLIKEKTDVPVRGELYNIDSITLADIDALEAHPIIYRREIIEVCTETGETVLAWAYLRHPNFKDKTQCFKEEEYV